MIQMINSKTIQWIGTIYILMHKQSIIIGEAPWPEPYGIINSAIYRTEQYIVSNVDLVVDKVNNLSQLNPILFILWNK